MLSEDERWKLWNEQGVDEMNKKEADAFARAVEAATEDAFLRKLGLDPDTYRTDGGEVNHLKVKAAIRNPNDYPLLCQHEWAAAPASLGGQICKHCGKMK